MINSSMPYTMLCSLKNKFLSDIIDSNKIYVLREFSIMFLELFPLPLEVVGIEMFSFFSSRFFSWSNN